MGVESVPAVEALSHADTLELSCHSLTIDYTAASSGIRGIHSTTWSWQSDCWKILNFKATFTVS